MGEEFWTGTRNINIIIALGTFLFNIIIWIIMWNKRRIIQQTIANNPAVRDYPAHFKAREGIQTETPMALCFSLSGNEQNIIAPVKRFLRGKNMKMKNIISIERNGLTNNDL